jgi:hypothetical protein
MLYMVTFTINIPPMLAYIAYMDPMGYPMNVGTKAETRFGTPGSVASLQIACCTTARVTPWPQASWWNQWDVTGKRTVCELENHPFS